ncbi:methyl-accepting chemotaxis protein [Roseobacter sp. SK209-2-6]|uniref:methyl-accepting chemotaxis protein n=1 Tax=Roseobacter sp. SK209-2-6 TaxID=388739 RepID=UPI0000F3C5D3|nr:methyl-accepting chemotaxis protein [Roseobacter sp. SK209-2-6]EBA18643.1 methyl-accepting chemotaxis protein [Roseobacter sp. SK209-2-6]
MPNIIYRLSARIYLLAGIAIALAALLTFFILSRAVQNAYDMREQELHQLTDLALSQLSGLEAQVQAGTLDEAEARELGRDRLTALRFGEAGYFYAFDLDLVIRAHPTRPNWVGTTQTQIEDLNGVRIFPELLAVAENQGAGPLIYHFSKPDSDVAEAKMGYVQLYEPWGWVVGTGAYVADIDEELSTMRLTAGVALLVSLAILAVGAGVITKSVTGPIGALKARMQSMTEGNTEDAIPATDNKGEVGEIAGKIEKFRQSLHRQKGMEQEQRERERTQAEVVEVLSRRLSALSGGDLTNKIGSNFPEEYSQLRCDFNKTVDQLGATISKVVETTGSIRKGASEISQASEDLSHRTESQAATLEETAAALDELTASVKSAADGARRVENTMEEARQEAENSGEVVQSAVTAMTEIEQSSSSIAQIISVIDDIAFQTNLLALNAGVEAARAGEAGKGFAVVASEVRALAQRSSDAAMEIKTLIGDSSKQVERGVDLVGKAGDALHNIVERVSHISKLITGIAEGAVEQSTGLGEINTGVTQLDQVTQQNAAMVEEAKASGHMLNNDAAKLVDLVAGFKLGTHSHQGGFASKQTPPVQPVAPSAHGGEDWDQDEAEPTPAAQRSAQAGNTAEDLWQEF